jgi:hypothetical protein
MTHFARMIGIIAAHAVNPSNREHLVAFGNGQRRRFGKIYGKVHGDHFLC